MATVNTKTLISCKQMFSFVTLQKSWPQFCYFAILFIYFFFWGRDLRAGLVCSTWAFTQGPALGWIDPVNYVAGPRWKRYKSNYSSQITDLIWKLSLKNIENPENISIFLVMLSLMHSIFFVSCLSHL